MENGNSKANPKRGNLRIYLGFAPGVGKTFTMLREALYLKKQNYDVVIGWLEEKSRDDTFKLAGELEVIEPLIINYKDNLYREMNVEEIIRRKPYLVLVDELAHTNIHGSVRQKRFEDVEYILEHGINVATTLNVYHIEEVKDAAAKITGINITETVPNWVLNKADEVQLIDVSPQAIRERVKEGKVFSQEMINRNTFGLFSTSKLLALRELALRYVADEEDEHLNENWEIKEFPGISYVNEKVLSCMNSSETALRLIATGGNMAKRMAGEFFTLFVQVDSSLDEREEDFELVTESAPTDLTKLFERLTKEYDGKFLLAKVPRKAMIPEAIIRVIKEKKITQVVIGESRLTRWKEVLHGSIITKIISKAKNTDILVAGNRKGMSYQYINKQKSGEESDKTGKLKVYIGAAAGVGKTVAMLREAHELTAAGTDVVIGIIETHNRKETEEYIGDLEQIPSKVMIYRDLQLKELDVQAILERKPETVLIDELAHSNPPGLKNEKRYQDITDILQAGINVISALNIQHIESLNDIVEDVTGVKVKETVPDEMLTMANELVMVDVDPETLLERLKSGKIYSPEKVEQALNSFFRKGNLQVLREIGLREIAGDIETTKEQKKILKGSRKFLKENVLVCIKAEADNERLIRRGFKITQRLNAKFNILHVIDDRKYSMEESQQLDILKALGEKLGGIFTIERVKTSRQINEAILQFISKENITRVVLGQSARTRWEEVVSGSIVNKILSKAEGIDILVLGSLR